MKKIEYNLKDLYNVCIEKGFITKDIDYKTFSSIIRDFSAEISKKILRGYSLDVGHKIGHFSIIKDLRRGKTINWGASNKYRDDLVKQGKIPFDKELAPQGEHWLIYYTDDTYYKWKWFKIPSINYIKNIQNYVFKPCTFNRRNIAKVIQADNFVTETYVQYNKSSI